MSLIRIRARLADYLLIRIQAYPLQFDEQVMEANGGLPVFRHSRSFDSNGRPSLELSLEAKAILPMYKMANFQTVFPF